MCRVPSVGMCVSPVHCLSLCVAFGRYPGCVGVPGHSFSSYMYYISTWYGHYFLISLRSTLLSPYYNFTTTSNILTYCYLVKYPGGHHFIIYNHHYFTTKISRHYYVIYSMLVSVQYVMYVIYSMLVSVICCRNIPP